MEPEGVELTPSQVQAQRLNALQDEEETFGLVSRGDRPLGARASPSRGGGSSPSSWSSSCGRLVCLAAGCAVLYGEFRLDRLAELVDRRGRRGRLAGIRRSVSFASADLGTESSRAAKAVELRVFSGDATIEISSLGALSSL